MCSLVVPYFVRIWRKPTVVGHEHDRFIGNGQVRVITTSPSRTITIPVKFSVLIELTTSSGQGTLRDEVNHKGANVHFDQSQRVGESSRGITNVLEQIRASRETGWIRA
jgi:hypothetical protein